MVSDCSAVLDTLGSVFAFALLAFAGGMYPVGLMLGAPCSPCCQKCSQCNYFEHTLSDIDQIQITQGSFTLTHPGFGSSASSSVQPGEWTRALVVGSAFSQASDIKENFMDGCLAAALQLFISDGGTREQFKADLNIGVSQYEFTFIGGPVLTDGDACSTYNTGAQILISLSFVDFALFGIIRQNTPLGVCPNEASVTVSLDRIDSVTIDEPIGSILNACEQQLTDFCEALNISGSFTHTGCFCGACCSYSESDGSLVDCTEDISEGACQDFDFKYFPGVEKCEDAECPDYREF